MDLFIFLGAISAAVLVFEILTATQAAFSTFGRRTRIDGAIVEADKSASVVPTRRTTWEALLIAVLPSRFDPSKAKRGADVVNLLRRSGYPYETPGAFYAAAMRTFSIYLVVAGLLAGALFFMDMVVVAPAIAAVFIFLGLRRPYAKLKVLAKKRAEAMRNNMLIGLSVFGSLLSSSVAVQDALRQTAIIGGPFCNLLGFLVARMEQEDIEGAIETTRLHLPDPDDVEANLFLQDISDHFAAQKNREIGPSVQALQAAVHRLVIESTEERVAMVRQRAGLFGFMAVLGLVLAIIAPFFGAM